MRKPISAEALIQRCKDMLLEYKERPVAEYDVILMRQLSELLDVCQRLQLDIEELKSEKREATERYLLGEDTEELAPWATSKGRYGD